VPAAPSAPTHAETEKNSRIRRCEICAPSPNLCSAPRWHRTHVALVEECHVYQCADSSRSRSSNKPGLFFFLLFSFVFFFFSLAFYPRPASFPNPENVAATSLHLLLMDTLTPSRRKTCNFSSRPPIFFEILLTHRLREPQETPGRATNHHNQISFYSQQPFREPIHQTTEPTQSRITPQ
jgi:hypothetical protein